MTVKHIEKIHRRSAGRRPERPVDKRRSYRAAREGKAYALPKPKEVAR